MIRIATEEGMISVSDDEIIISEKFSKFFESNRKLYLIKADKRRAETDPIIELWCPVRTFVEKLLLAIFMLWVLKKGIHYGHRKFPLSELERSGTAWWDKPNSKSDLVESITKNLDRLQKMR